MQNKEWKQIEGFENYAISNCGKVKSFQKYKNGKRFIRRYMKLIVHTNNYHIVWLRANGHKKKFFVHRLVALHFLDRIEGKEYVNHKDKDRLHNHVRNLEFMTHAENMYHRDNYKPEVEDELTKIPF